MKVGIVDVDGHNFPNLALARLAAGFRGEFLVLTLAKDLSVLQRINRLINAGQEMGARINPFVMPYRDLDTGAEPPRILRQLARWCNRVWIRKSCTFDEYLKTYERTTSISPEGWKPENNERNK